MSKKLSWSVLISFFIFDNLFSYYAITRLDGHEANWIIAYYVEKYPLLYFLCIPALIFIMFLIVKLLVMAVSKISFFQKVDRKHIEKIILGSMVIYWFVANSSLNVAFVFGYRHQGEIWYLTTLLGIFLGFIYFLFLIRSINPHSLKTNRNLSSN